MNSLALKNSFRSLSKNLNKLGLMRFSFKNKKTVKPTSGSDIEANKSKRSLRNDNSDHSPDEIVEPKTSNINTNVKQINSVPNHKSPTKEDTYAGRYAETLFIAGSKAGDLYSIYNDCVYIVEAHKTSETLRTFIGNAGLSVKNINSFCEDWAKLGEFSKTTVVFIDLLAKNKRFIHIDQICKKFIKSYQMLSKEEKITIISALELNDNQRVRVREALEANPENEGKTFIIEFTVNASIKGGLQMYTENSFMDLSLNSRIDKLKEGVNRYL
jgi:ATP synthase F1 delta subunit